MRATPEARADVEAAHALAEALGDEAVLARALLVRGEIERAGGDYSGALTTLIEAVDHFQGAGDNRGAADALREIGMVRIFLGRERRSRGRHPGRPGRVA